MLHAVLSIAECSRMVAYNSISYTGHKFPPIPNDQFADSDYAILSIGAEESEREWPQNGRQASIAGTTA
jgi:hypothetical protein